MARIRSIKPEFWDDEHVASLPMSCRLFYIGCWTFADDQGVFNANPSFLKSRIFPYDDDLKVSDVKSWLKKLEELEMIIPFSHKRDAYYLIRSFSDHQVIDKRYFKRVVPEDVVKAVLDTGENSTGDHTVTTTSTPRGHAENSTPDRIGEDSNSNVIVNNSHAHVRKEKQQEAFYECMFFRNLKNPKSEVDRFIGHNESFQWTGKSGRVWSTTEERVGLAMQWKPKDAGDRCKGDFLKMWKSVYDAVKRSRPDMATRMLDENADGGWRDGKLVIYCRSDVADFLKRNIDVLSPIMHDWSRGAEVTFQLPYN